MILLAKNNIKEFVFKSISCRKVFNGSVKMYLIVEIHLKFKGFNKKLFKGIFKVEK